MTDSHREQNKRPDPFCLVIFGASGDLTHRKLIPALYQLFCQNLLPDAFTIIGFARRDIADDAFRDQLQKTLTDSRGNDDCDLARWPDFASRIQYHRADFDDPKGFTSLNDRINRIVQQNNTPKNVLYYLATTPQYFPLLVDQLRNADLASSQTTSQPWTRLIVEKPFGHDLDSAQQLNRQIKKTFAENQIFRIDHYLGKETVQNLLVLRFANSIFEPLWNAEHIDHVQITVAESIGVENRGPYYDHAGALRDMVQNHMMHLLTLVAAEPPESLTADAIRNEKVRVLNALEPISPDCAAGSVVRGQYIAGTYKGNPVPAYRDEPRVPHDSKTETYVAFKAFIDNPRWSGVPFYLRTGKRMPARITDIGIHFKAAGNPLFKHILPDPAPHNILAIRIQPQEGIRLRFQVKVPGPTMTIDPLQMDFNYAETFCKEPPEAYQRLLLDAALGDSTLFTRDDEIEAAWSFVAPILQGCARQSPEKLAFYPAGSWGPAQADQLIQTDNRKWDILKKFVSACPISLPIQNR